MSQKDKITKRCLKCNWKVPEMLLEGAWRDGGCLEGVLNVSWQYFWEMLGLGWSSQVGTLQVKLGAKFFNMDQKLSNF